MPIVRSDRVGAAATAYRNNKARVLATQTVCGICGKPVDFDFKYPHPLSPVVDHIIPVSKGGHPFDMSNLQLAHFWCNRQKSDKLVPPAPGGEVAMIKNDDLPLSFDWSAYHA